MPRPSGAQLRPEDGRPRARPTPYPPYRYRQTKVRVNTCSTGLLTYFELIQIRITGLSRTRTEPDSGSHNLNLDKLKFSSVAGYSYLCESFWTNEPLDEKLCFHIKNTGI